MTSNEKWMFDSRWQEIPLRPDPEGVWRHRQSFRLNFTKGERLVKKYPRIAIVLAMREIPNLDFRPDSLKSRVLAYFGLSCFSAMYTALVYGVFLKDFFGAWNWTAIFATFVVIFSGHLISTWHSWRRDRRRWDEICRLLQVQNLYCAGCWYPLEHRYESDGCIICPECGAAWNLGIVDGDELARS